MRDIVLVDEWFENVPRSRLSKTIEIRFSLDIINS